MVPRRRPQPRLERWRYHYPQRAFPYATAGRRERPRTGPPRPRVRAARHRRLRRRPLLDRRGRLRQGRPDRPADAHPGQERRAGGRHAPRPADAVVPQHVVVGRRRPQAGAARPTAPATVAVDHADLGALELRGRDRAAGRAPPALLFCENETNAARLFDGPGHHAVPQGRHQRPRGRTARRPSTPTGEGTKAAAWYEVEVDAGRHGRAAPAADRGPSEAGTRVGPRIGDLGAGFETVDGPAPGRGRRVLRRAGAARRRRRRGLVMRQAFAGMLWSKQSTATTSPAGWTATRPAAAAGARLTGRNAAWRHLDALDIMSMPDTWEYPWFAAWDLGLPLRRPGPRRPGVRQAPAAAAVPGVVPAPQRRAARLRVGLRRRQPAGARLGGAAGVRASTAARPRLPRRVFHKLLLNFTWWVNREDAEGNNVFEGGFLGLDNIGPFDRVAPARRAARLEQSDGTAWMAFYCLKMLEIASCLADGTAGYEDLRAQVPRALRRHRRRHERRSGLWDDERRLLLRRCAPRRTGQPVRVRSMVGLIPLLRSATVNEEALRRRRGVRKPSPGSSAARGFADPSSVRAAGRTAGCPAPPAAAWRRRAPTGSPAARVVFDEDEFLSPHGLRSLSRQPPRPPVRDGGRRHPRRVDYEPAESQSGLFGGNSNWRGPVWFPLNYLVIERAAALPRLLRRRLHGRVPDRLAASGDARRRRRGPPASGSISLFRAGPDGRRPVTGGLARFQADPALEGQPALLRVLPRRHGAGLGASHQTGWTGLVADLDLPPRRTQTRLDGPRTRAPQGKCCRLR